MESGMLKYTQEYDIQNRLKALKLLNAKVTKSNFSKLGKNKCHFEFTVEDDEILDPVKCVLSDDEETWLHVSKDSATGHYLKEDINSSVNSESIWDWLRFSACDVQLAKLQKSTNNNDSLNISSSPSLLSSKEQSLLDSSDQGYRRSVVDSRTYTRPKKRSFQTIVGRNFDGSSSINENAGILSSPLTSTTSSTATTTTTTTTTTTITTDTPCATTSTSSCVRNISSGGSTTLNAFSSPCNPNNNATTATNRNSNNCTPVLNQTCATNNTFTTSLGIIDIDQLTNSQLGFNNVLDMEEAKSLLGHLQQPQTERKISTPSIVSNQTPNHQHQQPSDWKYKLDESFITSTPILTTNKSNNSCNPNSITSTAKITNDDLTMFSTTAIEMSAKCNSISGMICKGDKSKLFNATASELLQISFPRDYLNTENSQSLTEVTCSNVTNTCNKDDCKNDELLVTTENNIDTENKEIDVNNCNNEFLNNDEVGINNDTFNIANGKFVSPPEIINECSQVETPPQQLSEFNNPVSISTPTDKSKKNFINYKQDVKSKINVGYKRDDNTRLVHENGISNSCGRLSDSSTDTDIPSISMEDLREEQISPVLNQIYNANSTRLINNTIHNDSTINKTHNLDRTYELLPKTSANILNTTINNKVRSITSGSSILNPSFRKSPLNTTFCKSTEALNGGGGGSEHADSGPEDDCMSTASDSSFSSSSTHMRSVGEIQSIARLQEESLRQQNIPKRKLAWGGIEGLQDSSADIRKAITKLSSDDGNHSDQSDRSSDRYSPTTVNNNDRSALSSNVDTMIRYPRVPGMKHFGGSTELYPNNSSVCSSSVSSTSISTVGSNESSRRSSKMSGLRPPTMFNRTAVQQTPACAPAQSGLARPSGIRPPSVIPRPVSRLPAPKVRSGLPKLNARGGRH
ncbi:uncharacterized protein LOC142332160 [Lycorma delicatula]|uniref:uncharacterized protein LOC142332160 n=1 Tax=Lycorma delicatula TaxID=130591 RepID=UPI003F51190B